ncbi:unnamed protein product, partial [Rotaria magnacalcarata]
MKIQNDNQQSSSSQPSNNGTTVGANGVSATQQQDALNLSERSVRRVLIVAFNLIPSNDRSLQITAETVINDYS